MNRLVLTYWDTTIPGHVINWVFKFWTMSSLNAAAGGDFESLSDTEKEAIFVNTAPNYTGNGPSDYGSLTSSSSTDSCGVAESIYTSGWEEGYIEIGFTDSKILLPKR